MATNIVQLNPEYFPDPTAGRPIANADIFVGIIDLDPEIGGNQKQISVQQENGTITPISQPISTGSGGVPLYNGSPVTILVDGNYSLKVLDKTGSQIYYIPSVANFNTDAVTRVNNIFDMIGISNQEDGETVSVLGYFATFPQSEFYGGGEFTWQEDLNKNIANGGTIIDPDNTGGFDGTISTRDAFLAAQGSGVGNGCWVRTITDDLNTAYFGSVIGSGVDETTPIQSTIDFVNILDGDSHGITVLQGVYEITTIDLTDYKGVYFRGVGKSRVSFQVQGAQTNAISINKGVDGSNGSINNTEIGGFFVDCTTASSVGTGVYMDNFRRGSLYDVEVTGAEIGFRFAFGWITRLERLTSTNHEDIGFLINGNAINSVVCDTLSSTTSSATAKNYSLLANSLELINCSSEGAPLNGFVCEEGYRKISFFGGHVEGDTAGILSQSSTTNGATLTVDSMFFFSCNTPLDMTVQARNVTFVNNIMSASTVPADVVVNMKADSYKYENNVIEDSVISEEHSAVTIGSNNNLDRAVVSRPGIKLEFSINDFKLTDRVLTTVTSLTDIETYQDVASGSAGTVKLIQRLSGTNTSFEVARFRISEDNVIAWGSSQVVGTNLITALGYNAATKRLQLNAAFAGSAFFQMEIFRDP